MYSSSRIGPTASIRAAISRPRGVTATPVRTAC